MSAKKKDKYPDCPVCLGSGVFDAGDDAQGLSQWIDCPACELSSRIARLEEALKTADEILEKWDESSMLNFNTNTIELSFSDGNAINSMINNYSVRRIATILKEKP